MLMPLAMSLFTRSRLLIVPVPGGGGMKPMLVRRMREI
jgi:hypothetical protein